MSKATKLFIALVGMLSLLGWARCNTPMGPKDKFYGIDGYELWVDAMDGQEKRKVWFDDQNGNKVFAGSLVAKHVNSLGSHSSPPQKKPYVSLPEKVV